MAKTPIDYLDVMSQNSNGPLDGDLVASLTNMGENILAKHVEQMSKLRNQHSTPQPHVLAETMGRCSQVMHAFCSRILREIPRATDGASATPAKRKKVSSAKESGPDSNNKRTLLGTNPVQFAKSPGADLRRAGASDVFPTLGNIDSMGMIDKQMLKLFDCLDIPDGDLDNDLWDELSFSDSDLFNPPQIESTTSAAANSCAKMMLLCSQVLHVCSRVLQEIPPAEDGARATPAKKKKASSTATAVSPTPGDIGSIGMIDEQTLEPLNFRDIPNFSFSDSEFFNGCSVAVDSCAGAAQDQAGPGTSSVENDPSSGKIGSRDRKQGKDRKEDQAGPGTSSVENDPLSSKTQSQDGKQGKGRKQDQAGPGTSSVKNDPSSGKNQSRDEKQLKGRKQDQDGPGTSLIKNDPSSGKNRSREGEQGKGRKLLKALYLNKLVVNTIPKMPLREYLRTSDGKLVCLCGRGGHAHHHAGNKDYLESIKSRLPDYRSRSRKEKEKLTNALVQEFQEDGWCFLRVNRDDEWEEMDHDAIRRKVSQNFRDGPTPLPEEGERRGPRGAKRRQSDAFGGGGEAPQPTPPAA